MTQQTEHSDLPEQLLILAKDGGRLSFIDRENLQLAANELTGCYKQLLLDNANLCLMIQHQQAMRDRIVELESKVLKKDKSVCWSTHGVLQGRWP
jgi:hypothetical protein